MSRLLAGIEERRQGDRSPAGPPTIEARLPARARRTPVAAAGQAGRDRAGRRPRGSGDKDPSLWGGPADMPEIEQPARLADRVGDDARAHRRAQRARGRSAASAGYTDAVLLGMGGSSLGPEVLRRSFGDVPGGLRLQVLDSTHPDAIAAVQELDRHRQDDLHRLLEVRRDGRDALALPPLHGQLAGPEQFVVVTDPGSPLDDAGRAGRAAPHVPQPARHRRALLGACRTSGWCRPR